MPANGTCGNRNQFPLPFDGVKGAPYYQHLEDEALPVAGGCRPNAPRRSRNAGGIIGPSQIGGNALGLHSIAATAAKILSKAMRTCQTWLHRLPVMARHGVVPAALSVVALSAEPVVFPSSAHAVQPRLVVGIVYHRNGKRWMDQESNGNYEMGENNVSALEPHGVTLNYCTSRDFNANHPPISFDIDISGTATIGLDYYIRAKDVGPNEFEHNTDTDVSYSFRGGGKQCTTFVVIFINDVLDEIKKETIRVRVSNVRNAILIKDERRTQHGPTDVTTIVIVDDDPDRSVVFTTHSSTTLPSIVSEDIFGAERYDYDRSKHYQIVATKFPSQGGTSMEFRFEGTAVLGVDYHVRGFLIDPVGQSIRQPTKEKPFMRWTFWEEDRTERIMYFRIRVLDDDIAEDTESIVIHMDPGNLVFDGVRGIKTLNLRLFDNERPAPAAEAGATFSNIRTAIHETLNQEEVNQGFREQNRYKLSFPRHQVKLTLSFTIEGTASRCTDYVFDINLFPGDGSGSNSCDSQATTARFSISQRPEPFGIGVRAVDDSLYEGESESFTINLGNDSQGNEVSTKTIIIDNDHPPLITISSPSVDEGDTGDMAALGFMVTKTGDTAVPVMVDYEITSGSTATSSGSGKDYTHTVSSPLTFAPDETSKTIDVTIDGDDLAESDETVVIRLSSLTNGRFTVDPDPAPADVVTSIEGTGTIRNDDSLELSISDESVMEGDTTDTTLTFTVMMSAMSTGTVTLDYAVTGGAEPGEATAGTDFTAGSGSLTFMPGESTKPIDVEIKGDMDIESHETLTVTLSNLQCNGCPAGVEVLFSPAGTTVAAIGTILDNEAVQVSISAPDVEEGGMVETSMLVFNVTLSKAGSEDITVEYRIASGGTAQGGIDFEDVSGTLTFDNTLGEMSKPVEVTVYGDDVYEEDETVLVELLNPSGETLLAGSASTLTGTGTILNDDDAPLITISSPGQDEGNDDGANVLVYNVTKTGATALPVTVDYAISNDSTATATGDGIDFTHTLGSPLSFASAETLKTIEVAVVGDTVAEADESVIVTLSSPVNARFADDAEFIDFAGTIRNDDDFPLLAFGDLPTVTEGDADDTTMLRFEITKNGETALPATVAYAIGGGDATSSGADADFTHADTSITLQADQESAFIDIAVNGDDLVEVDETLTVTLSMPENARFTGNAAEISGDGVIANDDFLHVSIDAPMVNEGTTGESPTMTFTATLSARSTQSVTVEYQIITDISDADIGTATYGTGDGTDFTADTLTGTLTFAANTPAPQPQTFSVTVRGDTDREPNETVVARLHTLSQNAAFSGDLPVDEILSTGTIVNDDNPSFTVDQVEVSEGGEEETTDLIFTVNMTIGWSSVVTVDYAVTGGTAEGEATAGEDFVAIPGMLQGTLTFNPGTGGGAGETVKTVTVQVIGDDYDEADEVVTLTLFNASPDAQIQTADWTGIIIDDDELPVFSISSPSVDEGDPAVDVGDSDLTNLTFAVALAGETRRNTSVAFAVEDGTATGGSGTTDDYVLLDGGILDFAPSEILKEITVQVRGDRLSEINETVTVTLLEPTLATLDESGTTGTGTIVDDDPLTLSINSPSAPEYISGAPSVMQFTVSLEAETPAELTVEYAVTGGTAAGEATEGDDFTAISGRLTFTPGGGLAETFEVSITDDQLPEGRETLTATLSNPLCAMCPAGVAPSLETSVGTGTIIDDDALSISVSTPSALEGGAGEFAMLDFEVMLDFPWDEEVTVEYSVSSTESTATSGTDFEELFDGTLIFPSSMTELSQTVSVRVIGDSDVEPSETVVVEFNIVTDGVIFAGGAASASRTGTIANDDFSFAVEASPASVTEPDTGTADLRFTVTLTPAASSEFHIRYSFGGTAAEGFDYTDATLGSSPGVLTYADGESSKTIHTLVHSDFVAEDPETVIVTLVDESGATIESATATATIQPAVTDVDAITIEVESPQVDEGGSDGSPQVEFGLLLSAPQNGEVTVAWVLSEVRTEEVDSLQTGPFARAVRVLVTTDEIASGTATVPVNAANAMVTAALNAGVDLSSIDGKLVIEMERPTGVDGIEIQQAAGISAPVQSAVDANGRVAAAVFDAPDTEPAPTNESPTFSVAGPESVTEPSTGTEDLEFTVRLAPAASSAASVRYSFGGTATEGADYTDETMVTTEGVLEFAAGDTRKIILVRVNSDFVADEEETITVTLSQVEGASIDAANRTATVTIEPAASTATAAKLSVSSAAVANSEDDGPPVVTFNLHLDVAQTVQVTVMWVLNEARDGVVHRKLASGSAELAINSMREEISDSMDNGITLGSIRGQLVLEMERPSIAGVEIVQAPDVDSGLHAEASRNDRVVVVVFSAGSRSRDWATTSALSGFGRSAAVSLVNTIWSRTEAHRHGGAASFVSLGGRSVDVSAYSPGADARGAAKETARVLGLEAVSASSTSAGWLAGEPQVSGDFDDFMRWASLPDSERVAKESSFALALGEGSTGGSSFVYWGAASNGSFGSELEHDDGEFSDLKTDGSTTTISLGFDYRMSESMLLGLAVSSVSGSVEYSFAESDEKGELTPSLTGFTPWLRWQSSAGLEVWGAVGIGSGSAESKHSGDTMEMDLSSQTIAVGIWSRVTSFGSVGVAAKADVVMASLSTDGAGDAVDDAGADSQRIRVAAEMTPGFVNTARRTTSYSFEVGARQDGGEAESGVGVDAAGNFSYTSPGGGLQISGRGSLVVFHGQEGFSETGFGLGFSYHPGGDARGLQLSLEPTWNAPHTNAAGSMWNADSINSLSVSSSDGAALKTRLGYGVGAIRERALATLYGEAETGETDQRMRMGAELRGKGGALDRLVVDFYGERKEGQSLHPEQGVMLEVLIGF